MVDLRKRRTWEIGEEQEGEKWALGRAEASKRTFREAHDHAADHHDGVPVVDPRVGPRQASEKGLVLVREQPPQQH